MNDTVAAVMEFLDEHKVALFAIAASLLMLALSRKSLNDYRDAGQERLGIYTIGASQQWVLFALITAPLWISSLIRGTPIETHLFELGLTTPIAPQTMLNWSAALALAMAAAAWAANAAQEALKIPPTRLQLLLPPRTTRETITFVLLVAPTAGITEEIVFRGLLLPFAIEQTGDLWLGIAATSALFGIIHFPQGLLAVLAITLMGAILAIGFVYSGSLWPCIIAHVLYDMAYPFLIRYDELIEADAKG